MVFYSLSLSKMVPSLQTSIRWGEKNRSGNSMLLHLHQINHESWLNTASSFIPVSAQSIPVIHGRWTSVHRLAIVKPDETTHTHFVYIACMSGACICGRYSCLCAGDKSLHERLWMNKICKSYGNIINIVVFYVDGIFSLLRVLWLPV